MKPEPAPPADRFALFTSGARFSREVLQALLELGYPPVLVVLPTYPPAAPGIPGEIDLLESTESSGLLPDLPACEVIHAPRERQAEAAIRIEQAQIDYGLVACWPYLIAPVLISAPLKALLNLHPSLLPRYRGADPVGAQIERREKMLGVTLHLLDERFDHGPIVGQASFDADDREIERHWIEMYCARLGARLFVDAVRSHDRGWNPRPQKDRGRSRNAAAAPSGC